MTATTFSRLTSEQSKLVRQQDKNEGTDSDNNFTQLILTLNNIALTLSQLDNQLSHFISAQINDTRGHPQYECGPGLWWQVAYLDMTDPSQQCPSAWREYNTSGVKACGRPASSTRSCAAEFYSTNRQYTYPSVWKNYWLSSCKSRCLFQQFSRSRWCHYQSRSTATIHLELCCWFD